MTRQSASVLPVKIPNPENPEGEIPDIYMNPERNNPTDDNLEMGGEFPENLFFSIKKLWNDY